MGAPGQRSVTTMWSNSLIGRPESHMTGVSFTRGGHPHCQNAPTGSGGYTVWRPDHWIFDGLSPHPGDIIGDGHIVVGYECDGCELSL